MKYSFDTPIDRRCTSSVKWDAGETELPMRGADMDFETAPEIREAIAARAARGVFGHTVVPDAWYQAYIGWWRRRHDFLLQKDWLVFCTGVVPAVSSIVRKLTTPAEKVLLLTPAHSIFFHAVRNNGREVLESPLKYEGGGYRIDYSDLERKLADPQAALLIFCNPHNPIGKLWNRETLEQIGKLCRRHHVTVVSDETHCDLTDPGMEYIPFASVSEECRENSITCAAPAKAFHLEGLQTAAVFVPDETLRHKVRRALNTDGAAEPNVFAAEAAVAAFTRGADWLDELRVYLYDSKQLAAAYAGREIPKVRIVPSQAAHFLWLDCTMMFGFAAEAARFIREKTGLYLSEGGQFGGNGEDFLRMNIACPRAVLQDRLERLKEGIAAYEEYALNLC